MCADWIQPAPSGGGKRPREGQAQAASLRCRFNRPHSSGMKWTLKGREEARPLQERGPGKSPGTGGRQAETAEAREDGFFVGGTRETAVRQGDFRMAAGSCSRPWRAAAARRGEEQAAPAEQPRRLADQGALWAEQGQRTLVTPGRKREEESGEAGAYEGENQVSKHSPLQPSFRCRPVSSPDIPRHLQDTVSRGRAPGRLRCVRRGERGF